VESVLRNMLAELDLTMGLSGCRTVAEVREATLAG
jgi:isopentenyl diphosphate isomerase/L-lactate dehydrogenase-like FMN-dependent dehydrogenase